MATVTVEKKFCPLLFKAVFPGKLLKSRNDGKKFDWKEKFEKSTRPTLYAILNVLVKKFKTLTFQKMTKERVGTSSKPKSKLVT